MKHICPLVLVAFSIIYAPDVFADQEDLGTQLMLCTFKLTDGKTSGTVFILNRTAPNEKPQSLLITAAHVLEQMKGDDATLAARKQATEDTYERHNVRLPVRKEGRPLWVRHADLDVAAMIVELPPEVNLPRLPAELLATDDSLKKYRVHPGDILRCIGFPHAAQFDANAAGFPVVRIGCLSGFPLLPTKITKTFLFDFNTFEGDSGSPVYFEEEGRRSAGNEPENRVQLILGLVHGQHFVDEKFKMTYQSGETRHRMGLGIIIHASAIRDTIELLDKKTPKPAISTDWKSVATSPTA